MNREWMIELVHRCERQTISRRQFLTAAAALGLSSTVADRALAEGSQVLEAKFASAQQARGEGYVIISNEAGTTFQRNFNPLAPTGGNARAATTNYMYEPLLVFDQVRGELMQSLATGYEFSVDNLRLTFHLLPDVTWSDGEPFTANDVVFTWDLFKSHDDLAGSGARSALPLLSSWEAVDDHTVTFTFASVFTPGLYFIAAEYIVPQHVWKDVENPATYANETPVATGPFTEVVQFQSQQFDIGVNPNYRFSDRLKINGARYPALADNAARALALQNGELDWASMFFPDIENAYVNQDPENNHYWFPQVGSTVLLWTNTQKPPFDNPDVRKAVSMALNRPLIVEIAMWDYTSPADATGIGPAFESQKTEEAKAAPWTRLDLEAAGKLLDDAGIPLVEGVREYNGQPWRFDLSVPADASDYMQASDIISQSLKELGVECRIAPLDFNALLEQIFNGRHDSVILWSSQGPTVYQFYRSTMATETVETPNGQTTENYSRWSSPDADALLAELGATSDANEIARISGELQMLFADNMPAIPLFYGPVWAEYTTHRFDGFPSADDPYAMPSPSGATAKNVMLHLFPVGGEAPQVDDIYVPAEVSIGGGATPEASPAT